MEDKINKFTQSSNNDEVSQAVDRFKGCIRDNHMPRGHTRESEAISNLSGKINGLQNTEQKKLAEDVINDLRKILTKKEEADSAWK